MAKAEVIKRPVEQIGKSIKQSAWISMLESLVLIVLGILLVVWPNVIIKVVAYVVGVFFIVKGGYQIINYFMVKGQNDFYNNNLLVGVISVLAGVAALVIGEGVADIFRIVVGIFLVYEALVRMNTAHKLFAADVPAWKYVMIVSLLIMIIGIFVTFYRGAVLTLIGWMMVISGIVCVFGDALFIQDVNTLVEKITGGKNERTKN